jgi:preprotein translocase SecE subunit
MPQSKPSTTPAAKPRNAIVGFISDTIAEMKKVTWLSRKDIVYLTGLVLLVSVAAGIVLGLVDLGFSQLINKLILGG